MMEERIRLQSNEWPLVDRGLRLPSYVLTILAASILVWCSAVAVDSAGLAQQGPPSDIAGRYEGFAESKNYGRVPLVVDLRHQGAVIVGSMHTPLGDFSINQASYSNATLTLKAESYDD